MADNTSSANTAAATTQEEKSPSGVIGEDLGPDKDGEAALLFDVKGPTPSSSYKHQKTIWTWTISDGVTKLRLLNSNPPLSHVYSTGEVACGSDEFEMKLDQWFMTGNWKLFLKPLCIVNEIRYISIILERQGVAWSVGDSSLLCLFQLELLDRNGNGFTKKESILKAINKGDATGFSRFETHENIFANCDQHLVFRCSITVMTKMSPFAAIPAPAPSSSSKPTVGQTTKKQAPSQFQKTSQVERSAEFLKKKVNKPARIVAALKVLHEKNPDFQFKAKQVGISCEDKQFRVNATRVAARSNWFYKLFTNPATVLDNEKPIVHLSDPDPFYVLCMCQFLCEDHCVAFKGGEFEDLVALLHLASKYEIDDLKEDVLNIISKSEWLSTSTANSVKDKNDENATSSKRKPIKLSLVLVLISLTIDCPMADKFEKFRLDLKQFVLKNRLQLCQLPEFKSFAAGWRDILMNVVLWRPKPKQRQDQLPEPAAQTLKD